MNRRIVIRLGLPRRYRLERLRKKTQDADLRTRISIVLVFDKGRIVQQGHHDELVAVPGIYRSLHESWIGNTRT